MITRLLAPFELVYLAGLRLKNARDRKRPLRHLSWPVVSVGNLSSGGSGKTPLVLALIRLLGERGFAVDVLSRGYRRQPAAGSDAVEEVDPEGSARRFGDEPMMIARATGARVFVGTDRYAAGQLAESRAPRADHHIHVLDDGFQHRRLARSLDIVVLHRQDFLDSLLPAGRLREPFSSLARADAIVLRAEDRDLAGRLQRHLRAGAKVWYVKRKLLLPDGPGRTAAFCAIARPREFHRALESAGAQLVLRKTFRDHHWYSIREIERLCRLGERAGCGRFVTTEKDAVRLDGAMLARLERVAPLVVARLSVEIEDEDGVMEDVTAAIGQPEVLP